jgi:hypothetical protein
LDRSSLEAVVGAVGGRFWRKVVDGDMSHVHVPSSVVIDDLECDAKSSSH